MQNKKNSLTALLMPSFLGILVCLICVSGMTWAWYCASISSDSSTINAAHYEISTEIKNTDNNEKLSKNADEKYVLPTGTYEITLTAQGDASTGYCKIKIDGEDNELHTEQIYTSQGEDKKNSITFTIEIKDEFKTLSFLAVWGTYSGESPEISDGTEYVIPAVDADTPEEPANPPVTDNSAPEPTIEEELTTEPVSKPSDIETTEETANEPVSESSDIETTKETEQAEQTE